MGKKRSKPRPKPASAPVGATDWDTQALRLYTEGRIPFTAVGSVHPDIAIRHPRTIYFNRKATS